jgi:hypothetical protein
MRASRSQRGLWEIKCQLPEVVNRWCWGAANPFDFSREQAGRLRRALSFLLAAGINAISCTLIKSIHTPHTIL